MSTRLQTDIKRRTGKIFFFGVQNGVHFCMGAAKPQMRAFTDDFMVFDQYGAHDRIRTHLSDSALGDLDRSFHEQNILGGYFLHSVLAILSRMPLTNFEESASPYRLASSTASLIATLRGISSRCSIS